MAEESRIHRSFTDDDVVTATGIWHCSLFVVEIRGSGCSLH